MDQPSPAQPIAPLPQPVTPTPVVTQSDQPQSATAQPVQPVATSTPVSPTQQENYLPGFKELLSRSWKIYKARWKTFVGIISIMNLIGFAAIIPIFIAISLSLFSSIKSPLMVLIFPVILTVSLIFLLIIYSWSRVSLLVAIRDSAEKLGTKDSISRSNVFVLRNLALTLIFGFAYLGGFLLFVVPGIILIVFLEFAEYALVSEDSGVIESLRKSKSYVKGKFLEVLYRLIAFTLFSLLVSMILSFIPLVNILFGVVSLLVITPLSAIYFFLMYSHLKTLENQPISNPLSTGKKIFTGVILILAILIPIILLFTAITSTTLLDSRPPPRTPTSSVPATQTTLFNKFEEAENKLRQSDISLIANAIEEYTSENDNLPPPIESLPTNQTIRIAKQGADLCSFLVPDFIISLTNDPALNKTGTITEDKCNSDYDTGYAISYDDSKNLVTISAPLAGSDANTAVTKTLNIRR